jgi:hypothetical protein
VHRPDAVTPFSGNRATRIGEALEPLIIDEAAAELETPVHKATHVLYHAWAPYLGCNLDGWAPALGVPVECKSIGTHHRSAVETLASNGYAQSGSYLEAYWTQVQAQIAITGAPYGYLAILCDRDLHMVMVPRDSATQDRIVEDVPAWVERHLIGGDEPAATAATDSDALKRAHPVREDYTIELGADDYAHLFDKRDALKTAAKEIKAQLAEIDAQILQASDGARRIACARRVSRNR